jgi:hypothetical protein
MDRGVAQRYAAGRKKRKRSDRPAPVARPVADRPRQEASGDDLEEALTGTSGQGVRSAPRTAPRTGSLTPSRTEVRRVVTTARPRVSSRKPFSAYADEYQYVAHDLRRLVAVAGGLLVLLVVLSFIIH